MHSTRNYHNCWLFLFSLHFADPGDQGHPAVQFLHTPLSTQTSLAILLVLPSPLPPHRTHSHFISVSKEDISTVFANFSQLFLSLLLLNSNEKVMEGIISTVFLGSSQHYNSNCSHTHRSTGHCTHIFMVAID